MNQMNEKNETNETNEIKEISKILDRGRLSHAYIIEGGSGERRLQDTLYAAKLILCPNRLQDGSPCGTCSSCMKVDEGVHPDLNLLIPQKEFIGIHDVRELLRPLVFSPLEGGMRVTVIHNAQKMGPEASNAILKTLEEPLAGNVFFLTVDARQNLLPTICSRCQIITLKQPQAVILSAGHEQEEEHPRFLLILSDGDAKEAARLKETGIIELRDRVFEILASFCNENGEYYGLLSVIELSGMVSGERSRFLEFIWLMETIARDVVLIGSSWQREGIQDLLIHPRFSHCLLALAQRFPPAYVSQYVMWLSEVENNMRRGINLEYASIAAILFWFGEYDKDSSSCFAAL